MPGSPIAAPQLSQFFAQVGTTCAGAGLKQHHLAALMEWRDPFLPDLDWEATYAVLHRYHSDVGFRPSEIESAGGTSAIADEWCLPVLYGLTPMKLIVALQKVGVGFSSTFTLDETRLAHVRDPVQRSYGIRFKRRVESDLTLRGRSNSELVGRNLEGITLVERMLLELAFFLTTGGHLDVKGHTACTGSPQPPRNDEEAVNVWTVAWKNLYGTPHIHLGCSYGLAPNLRVDMEWKSRKPCGKFPEETTTT